MYKNITKKRIAMLLIAIVLTVIPLTVVAEPDKETISNATKKDIQKSNISSSSELSNNTSVKYDDTIRKYSDEYGVDYRLMKAIMSCENYERDPLRQSDIIYNFTRESIGIYKGEREYSFGLVQINLHYNPKITYQQATDPDFSIEFLAKNLAKGRHSMWGCYTNGGYKKYL